MRELHISEMPMDISKDLSVHSSEQVEQYTVNKFWWDSEGRKMGVFFLALPLIVPTKYELSVLFLPTVFTPISNVLQLAIKPQFYNSE